MYVLLTKEFNGYFHSCDDLMNNIKGEYVVFELGDGVDEYLGDDEEFEYNDWHYLIADAENYSHLSEGKLEIENESIVINSYVQ